MKPKSQALLGTVDRSGIARYASPDIQRCRSFLRRLGLIQDGTGYKNHEMLGVIHHHSGEWHAAAECLELCRID